MACTSRIVTHEKGSVNALKVGVFVEEIPPHPDCQSRGKGAVAKRGLRVLPIQDARIRDRLAQVIQPADPRDGALKS